MITYYELLKMIESGKIPKYVMYKDIRFDLFLFKDNEFTYLWNSRDDLVTRINYKCSNLMSEKCLELPKAKEDFVIVGE